MTAIRRPRRFTLVPTNGRLRRISLVAGRPGEGPLTEPIAATQPRRQEPLFMPHSRDPSAGGLYVQNAGFRFIQSPDPRGSSGGSIRRSEAAQARLGVYRYRLIRSCLRD